MDLRAKYTQETREESFTWAITRTSIAGILCILAKDEIFIVIQSVCISSNRRVDKFFWISSFPDE